MSLVDEYIKQFAWRDWARALANCPLTSGQMVLDLGCGPGDISGELQKKGAIVTGIDGDAELLKVAKERFPECAFEMQNLNDLKLVPVSFDGLWCSFTAAYFTDFDKTFSSWLKYLKKDAWVCITDIDDLLGHEPLSAETRTFLESFYQETFNAGRYDFRAGSKIQSVLEKNGFRVKRIELKDQELSFDGPATPDVIEAWANRFSRMGGLKARLKDAFVPFVSEFTKALSSPQHRSQCKVVSCIGIRG